ncbi:HpcH/HpaI aldolase/citrate lyase family protein [Virgisporangium aurantiacum]|uniref:ATP/GTP-binding protein n=1 Tax=Virgisporangium aurantiacum TaxID=175570 RepID=A0A8J4E411_9ACTN|nr:HpcH/HpaI aldolase/citrate lyase family protein [Virgisporangium aurantiacum]GIJ60579.1 ATP/GTP-binding protein [Virgisporangium aurantiacum]
MRHFQQLPDSQAAMLFHRIPAEFTRNSPPDQLAVALGATLYAPAIRPNLADDLARCHRDGLMSLVCCLEDAIRDDEVDAAEVNLAYQLRRFADAGSSRFVAEGGDEPDGPLLFIRVRHHDQIYRMAERLGDAMRVVSGFVLPKFRPDESGRAGVQAVHDIAAATALPVYAMPVLETPEIAHAESRLETLIQIRQLLDRFRDRVLATRVGVTDLCGWYGLRRPAELTAWDLGLISTTLTDIINVMARRDRTGDGYVISGPVWEYFTGGERVLKPLLRESPFTEHDPNGRVLRRKLVRDALDGLIREILLDRANGLTGKTIIHPSHASAVHALSVVSHEEYSDAVVIAADANGAGGVLRSAYANKMNEVRPHYAWAQLTLLRARMFGVAAEGVSFVDFLDASVDRELVA